MSFQPDRLWLAFSKTCPTCNGEGTQGFSSIGAGPRQCPICKGVGRIGNCPHCDGFGEERRSSIENARVACTHCNDTGWVGNCPECRGTGMVFSHGWGSCKRCDGKKYLVNL